MGPHDKTKLVSFVNKISAENPNFPLLALEGLALHLSGLENEKGVFIFVFLRQLFLKWHFSHVKVLSGMTSIINQNRMQNILKQSF